MIRKETIHPEGDNSVDIYPKTSFDQVEGLDGVVVGNPTQSGEEELTKIKIGNKYYYVTSNGVYVEANPTNNNGDFLDGIQVGGTKYKLRGTDVLPHLSFSDDSILTNKPIITIMNGYYFSKTHSDINNYDIQYNYVGISRNGDKLTVVINCSVRFYSRVQVVLGTFYVPTSVGSKLIPTIIGASNVLDNKSVNAYYDNAFTSQDCICWLGKLSNNHFNAYLNMSNIVLNDRVYTVRYETTFLLGDNLASN